MLIIPSIYIQKGKCVSLYKGSENAQKKVYSRSPLNMAKEFAKQGASLISITDLDGSVQGGGPVNLRIIEKICHGVDVPIKVAGGIRDLATIDKLMKIGVKCVVLGVSARDLIPSALEKYGPEMILFGIKARRGWVESDSLSEESNEVLEIGEQMVGKGITQIVYKDMEREGSLFHPNYDEIERLLYFVGNGVKVYSSGGVVDMNDLQILENIGTTGVMICRALMEHKISLRESIANHETAQDSLGTHK